MSLGFLLLALGGSGVAAAAPYSTDAPALTLEEARRQIAELRWELRRPVGDRPIDDVRRQLAESDAALAASRAENAALAARLGEVQEKRTRLASALTSAEGELASARTQALATADRIGCLQRELAASQARAGRLEAAAASVPMLAADLGVARARVAELQRQKDWGRERIGALEGELASTRMRLRALEAQWGRLPPGRTVVVSRD